MAEYIRYEIKNTEPLRIADDSTSQMGQTNTLKYIPGTTMRGYVINQLAHTQQFEEIKSLLFSEKIRFLNAFPMVNGKELFPSLKGFYEDKTAQQKKKVESVIIDGNFTEGLKRASVGQFCYLEGDSIFYYSVDTGSDMKIKINVPENEKQNVFRNEYITSGNTYVGYIAIDESVSENTKQLLNDSIENQMILGNARSSGLGKCSLVSKERIGKEKNRRIQWAKENVQGDLYLMLLSHTAMRNVNGQYGGLNLSELESKLGVRNLKVAYCSTSTVNVRGYNRTWGVKIPSVMMYEQGSLFHLTFDGEAEAEKLNALMEKGIGVRKNEGFGQIVFLQNYPELQYKQQLQAEVTEKGSIQKMDDDDKELRQIAKNYYRFLLKSKMQENIIALRTGGISNSQIGNVSSIILANRFDYEAAVKALNSYFSHKGETEQRQRIQKNKASVRFFQNQIEEILEMQLIDYLQIENKTIMGIDVHELLSKEEEGRLKLDFIMELIRYQNRRGV